MDDPHALFASWLNEAEALEPNYPNAVTLATATADGRPSARVVLLKGHDARGFVIYTNRQSRKGDELEVNPRAALLFHWKSLRRQVRVEGMVARVSDAESDAYWASRGRDSRLGAWASDQSRPLDARETFERRVDEARARFEGGDVPRPDHWGGYRVAPERIEFWQDRAHRLHERRVFTRLAGDGAGDGADGGWDLGMLYP